MLFGHTDDSVSFDHRAALRALPVLRVRRILRMFLLSAGAHTLRRACSLALDIAAPVLCERQRRPVDQRLHVHGQSADHLGLWLSLWPRWSTASAILSIVGVGGVIAVTSSWQSNELASGVLVGPRHHADYAHKLMRNLWEAKASPRESNQRQEYVHRSGKPRFADAVECDHRLGDVPQPPRRAARTRTWPG